MSQQQIESQFGYEPQANFTTGLRGTIVDYTFGHRSSMVKPIEIVFLQKDHSLWTMWFKRVLALSQLPQGWDSYKAPAPSEKALRHALEFLGCMRDLNVLPSRVEASAMGGIAIAVCSGDKEGFVAFYNDGEVCSLLSDPNADPITKDVLPGSQGYQLTIREIRGFLHGDTGWNVSEKLWR